MNNEKSYLLQLMERDYVKEKEYDDRGWAICPVCHRVIGDGRFCRYCGQRLVSGSE